MSRAVTLILDFDYPVDDDTEAEAVADDFIDTVQEVLKRKSLKLTVDNIIETHTGVAS